MIFIFRGALFSLALLHRRTLNCPDNTNVIGSNCPDNTNVIGSGLEVSLGRTITPLDVAKCYMPPLVTFQLKELKKTRNKSHSIGFDSETLESGNAI
jgi:hypothetical protein